MLFRSFQIGARYTYNAKYDQEFKSMLNPYVAFNYTYYKQKAYGESGAGIFNQQVDAMHNNYLTGEVGLEFTQTTNAGKHYVALGYKRVLSGANPDFMIGFEGNPNHKMRISTSRLDKNYIVAELGSTLNLKSNWQADLQLTGEFGKKSHAVGASAMLRKTW